MYVPFSSYATQIKVCLDQRILPCSKKTWNAWRWGRYNRKQRGRSSDYFIAPGDKCEDVVREKMPLVFRLSVSLVMYKNKLIKELTNWATTKFSACSRVPQLESIK
jgi:hypothetical protein